MIENLHRIMQLVERDWEFTHVLVIGDVMLDKYIWGDVERISPEAPVPVVRAAHQSEQPGGAGNVAMNLAGLGAKVTLLGVAGGDSDQQTLERLFASAGVRCHLASAAGAPTTSKLRILGGNQQMLRLDTESDRPRSAETDEDLLRQTSLALEAADVVILSDYSKGVLSERLCQAAIHGARAKGIPVLVDPKGRSFHPYLGATTICPNLHELSLAAGVSSRETDLILAAGQRMVTELKLEYLSVTMSEKGIAILYPQERILLPAVARNIYDVSGAGDTVIATLALGLAGGLPAATAARLANIAAGIVVGKVGTVPVQRHELAGALSQEIEAHAEEKLLPLDRLFSRVASWRSSGNRIALVSGCFDLLHVGHISLLTEARRQADKVVVAIEDDAAVRKSKGPGRPIVKEAERGRILAALSDVDAVTVVSRDAQLEIIETLRPDVLVTGEDGAKGSVLGAAEVRARGGIVRVIPRAEEAATVRALTQAHASSGAEEPS